MLIKFFIAISCFLVIGALEKTSNEKLTSCTDKQFECRDGSCVYIVWVCDGYEDCPYGDDELGCSSTRTSSYPYTSPTPTIPYSTTPYPTTSYTSTTSQYLSSTATSHPPTPCDYPYESLGNRCIFVDPVLQATWDEARYMCGRAGGGDLVILDSLDFYRELIQYINDKGLTRHSYWVGGRGIPDASKWEWSSGSDVRMGTPLWAITNNNLNSSIYEQEPVDFDKSLENCAYLDLQRYHYMDDDDCNAIKATICQMPTWQGPRQDAWEIMQDESPNAEKVPKVLPEDRLQDKRIQVEDVLGDSPQGKPSNLPVSPAKVLPEDHLHDKRIQVEDVLGDSPQGKPSDLPVSPDKSIPGDSRQVVTDRGNSLENKTATQLSCNYPYDPVGGRCVMVDPVLKATWDEARYICGKAGGGDLVVLDSMEFYGKLLDFIKETGLEFRDYWIGGRGSESSGTWQWMSGSTIIEGTPLWAVQGLEDDGYKQEPTNFEESLSNCGYLDQERYLYMDDANCQELKAVICQIPTWI
ncbi:uncharacterized protein [Palaemon carinicauda]|uniref:uncharacterized protein isoform X2 n=1 Tax=Palaemon carinicauda TaxID=392227 RepID=UPI0035B6283E